MEPILLITLILFVILGLFLGVGSVIEDKDPIPLTEFVFGIIVMSMITIGFRDSFKIQRNSKNFIIETEIKQEFVNGVETSCDTIYIFTPKK